MSLAVRVEKTTAQHMYRFGATRAYEAIVLCSALLRTRVDLATEMQNQQLLEKLTRGQDMQLRLQSTVEGLSIAAISYYVVSLLLYAAKALSKLGLQVNPEMVAGFSIPLVLWGVWKTVQRIHRSAKKTASKEAVGKQID